MKPGLISVILPTTGRAERAVRCIEQLFGTVGDHQVEVICPVDADRETEKALCWLHVEKSLPVYVFSYPEYQGCAHSWNNGLRLSVGEYIVFAADDLWFENGWLEESLRVMSTLPQGVGLVGFNDGHIDGHIVGTHYMAHRKFILDYMGGVIGFECFKYQCNDLEATERAKRAGRYAWAENAHVRHDHPSHGTRPEDALDLCHRPFAQGDNDTFYARQAAGFPNDFPAVITE